MTVVDLVQSAEARIAKLEKINQALMGRVERSMDISGGAFSLFQAAILLEDKVKARTRALETTLKNLSAAYVKLGEARDEAERAKQNLTAAIEAVSEGFALFDHKERLVLCNRPFKSLFPSIAKLLQPGLPFPSIARLFSSTGVMILAEGQSQDQWVAQRVQLFRQPYSSFIQPFAEDRWIQVSNRKMDTGATVIFQTDITDIVRSERLRHEREIGEQSDVLQAMIDHLPQGIAMFAANTTLRAWNRAFVNLLHLPLRKVFAGTRLVSLLQHLTGKRFAADSGTLAAIRDWTIHPTRSDLAEAEIRRSDGVILALSSRVMPDGGFVITLTDVTRERTTTLALRETNESLESRVRERTHELTKEVLERREIEKALVRAKEDAENANQSRTQFFAAASHDLLQPLNAARLFLSQLTEAHLNPREMRLAMNADKAFASAEQLLDSLLDISRLESGGVTPKLSDFALSELFGTLVAEFKPVAARKGLTLRFVGTDANVTSDKALLRRVVQNLLSNAVRYTTQGKILLGCRRTKRGLRIEVWDTGRGIPSSKFKAVFQEFTRLESSTENEPHAMGLGLAIVARIAKLLESTVEVRSTVGKGSCFSITVPFAHSFQAEPGILDALAPPLLRHGAKSVLIIENDLSIIEGMVGLLDSRGFETIPTMSAEEALEAVQNLTKAPDLIIADYHLDGGTGLAAAAEINTMLARSIPTIVVTADRSLRFDSAQYSGRLVTLWKPLKTGKLFATIETMLDETAVGGAG